MGSSSDSRIMHAAGEILDDFGITHEDQIISAHRTPTRLDEYAKHAEKSGFKVIIAGAGMSAALPGVIAAQTSLPVLGVPMENAKVASLDGIMSILQMPAGIPVGALAVGRAGAVNAALLAAAILALSDPLVAQALEKFRADQAASVPIDPSD